MKYPDKRPQIQLSRSEFDAQQEELAEAWNAERAAFAAEVAEFEAAKAAWAKKKAEAK